MKNVKKCLLLMTALLLSMQVWAQEKSTANADFNLNAVNSSLGTGSYTTSVLPPVANWTTLASSPNALSRSCCAGITQAGIRYIYQFGGGGSAQLTSVARYNADANTWSNTGFASIPTGMSSATAIAVGDTTIFVFGGEGTTLGRTYRYNVSSNTWTTLANMPTPVTDALVLKYQDSLVYVIGGGTGTFAAGYVNNVQVYNINTNTYSAATPYPITAGMMGGGLVGNTIISAGGWNGTDAVASAYRGEIDPANPLTITWTPIADYPIGAVTRMASAVVSKGGTAVVFAGGAIGGATLTGESRCWNIANAIWEPLPVMPTPRSNMKGTNFGVTDSAMIVVAGFTTAGTGATNRIAFVSIDGSPNPLNPFNLVAPPNGATVLTSAGNTTPVTISWDTSATGARYNWIFAVDSTNSSPRLLTIPSNTNSLTLTLGQIDAALASLGLEPGQSQAGFWTVWAYKAPNAPGQDSLRANTWRSITFGRQAITLSPFNLLSPPDNSTLVTSTVNPAQINIRWSKSGTGAVTYKWFFTAPALTGSLPTLVVGSNNNGLDTTLTLVISAVDGILAGLGLARGDSAVGEWRVFAYRSATDSLASTQTFNITLKRQAVGEVAIVMDTTVANMRISRDTLINYLSAQNRTFDVVHRGSQTGTVTVDVLGYNTVVWLAEATNVGSPNTRQAIKDYLNAGTTIRKSKVIVFAEDFGYQFDRTGSGSLDTALTRDFFGVQYLADRPAGTVVGVGNAGNERVINLGFGIADSVAGAWPEVFRVVRPDAVPLYRFQRYTSGSDSVSSVGRATNTYNTALFGFDLRRIRGAFDSPAGATARALQSAFFFVDNGTPLSASEPSASVSRPKEFKLEQNYPNPFNPTTTIQFAVPSVSDVKLEVFNILGQKVASLVNRRMEAGVHTVNFNATNLSSGVYFYRLQSGSFVQTKKMMLVK